MVRAMDTRRGIFGEFLLATAVLTRLPMGLDPPGESEGEGAVAAACWAFPLVGAGIGFIAGGVFFAAQAAGLGSAAPALLAVLAGVLITGALHEDGLSDTADGLGGGADRERKLAIMRDSRCGTYGVVALVFGIGLRAAALATIGDPIHAGLALVAAHAASRGFLGPAMRLLAPARADGLGAAAGRPGLVAALVGLLLGALIALGCLGPISGLVALGLAAAAIAVTAALAQRQIGGYTGDVLGAFQQIGEIVMLLVASAS
ncbi:MAG TPA: adenosylcobinamide-GDP ribazoletransferase [Stellaceae bacterium]|nr:adenosylcobinamide-GDP ribazoletransferase [Stellaceae bacterium]